MATEEEKFLAFNQWLAQKGCKSSEWALELYLQNLEWPEPDWNWLASLSRWFQKNGTSLTWGWTEYDPDFDDAALEKLEDQIRAVESMNERRNLVAALNEYYIYGWEGFFPEKGR